VEATLADLEAALGHRFNGPDLLLCALTHRSVGGRQNSGTIPPSSGQAADESGEAQRPGDNERLEFLGDAVLGLVVAEALFTLHPEWKEGELTRVRALLVSRQHMAEVAASIGLGNYLRLNPGEERSALRRTATVLSNTMEAVIGALFMDGGLKPVRAFVRQAVMGQAVEQLAEELRAGAALGNYKSALQEHLQAAGAGSPVYRVKSESGPDHRKRFLVEVRLRSRAGEAYKPLARGMGSTKKHAEQDAARRALACLIADSNGADAGLEEHAAQ
jgi:ribonuclease III